MTQVITTKDVRTEATTMKGLKFEVKGTVNVVDNGYSANYPELHRYEVSASEKLQININGTWYEGESDHRGNGSFIRIKNCVLMPSAPHVDIRIDFAPFTAAIREMRQDELVVNENNTRKQLSQIGKDFENGTLDNVIFK